MKKLLCILLLVCSSTLYSQIVTQIYVDRCTGAVHTFSVPLNGQTVVTFYTESRTFTSAEFTNGTLQSWLENIYQWWSSLNPCSSAQAEATTAQQTTQQTTQAATQAAANAATSTPPATNPPNTSTNAPPSTDNTSSSTGGSTQSTSSNQTQNSSNNSESSSQNTSNTDGSNSSGESSSGNSSESSEGSGGQGETSKEDTPTEESQGESETKEEVKNDEEKSDESTEKDSEKESDEKESSDEESKEDEEENSKEESDNESEEEDDKNKKKKRNLSPPILAANLMSMQMLDGTWSNAASFGLSRSSLTGQETYSVNGMIWSNLKQFSLGFSKSKIEMWNDHQTYSEVISLTGKRRVTQGSAKRQNTIHHVGTTSLNLMYMFGTKVITGGYSHVILGQQDNFWKGFAGGYAATSSFIFLPESQLISPSLTFFGTKPFLIKYLHRWSFSPMLATSFSPLQLYINKNEFNKNTSEFVWNKYFTYITGVSGNFMLSQRFVANLGINNIGNTNKDIPSTYAITVGARFQF